MMARIAFWNPQEGLDKFIPEAMNRLDKCAELLKTNTKAKLASAVRHSISRPAYKSGPYAGKTWTAREAGALLKTVRVVKKHGSNARNVRVYVGNYEVYYGKIFEYSVPPKGHAFFRPAISQSKSGMKNIIERG
jgi:hypothetical protein